MQLQGKLEIGKLVSGPSCEIKLRKRGFVFWVDRWSDAKFLLLLKK